MFLDVYDLRVLFQTTIEKESPQKTFPSKEDFTEWLMQSANWVCPYHIDFGYDVSDTRKLTKPLFEYKGIEELYSVLRAMFDTPALDDKNIYNCYGFINGDILYIMLDVGEAV